MRRKNDVSSRVRLANACFPAASSEFLNAHVYIVLLLALAVPSAADAQTSNTCSNAKAGSLACLTIDLGNANNQQLGLPPIAAGFPTPVAAIAGQLSSAAPLPSLGSGFIYTFDPAAGVFTQSTMSYGPILAERAATIGSHRFSLGVTDQHFEFTRLDGVKLSSVPTTVSLGSSAYLAGRFNVHVRLNQLTMFGSYGLTNFLDVSVAAPVVHSEFGGSLTGQLHFGPTTSYSSATINRSANRFGDLQFQIKASPIRREATAIAFGVNVRTPTGDPYALSGAGAIGIEPFIAASKTMHRWFTPHVNVGYQWNGKSVLAGDVTTGATSSLPPSVSYAAGSEITVNRHLTIIEDIIGYELIHAFRLGLVFDPTVADGTIQSAGLVRHSFNSTGLSTGVKVRLGSHLLLNANLLARLNSGGLRAAVIPLIGLSYAFESPSKGAQPLSDIDAKPPLPAIRPITTPPSVDRSADAMRNREQSYQSDLHRMVQEIDSQAHFVSDSPPEFIAFHNGFYLRLSTTTSLPQKAIGSQYRVAALAFDQHIARLIRPVLSYLKTHQDLDGIDFRTSVVFVGNQAADNWPIMVDFIVPLTSLRSYEQFDNTGQQLIDASFVLINGERVSLNLQMAEEGFRIQ